MGLRDLDDLPAWPPTCPRSTSWRPSSASSPRPQPARAEPEQPAPDTSPSRTERRRSSDRGLTTEGIRLQKVLAAAGIGSRRACEIMISEGRVEVNGRLVSEQGVRVDPERDVIRVDGCASRRRAGLPGPEQAAGRRLDHGRPGGPAGRSPTCSSQEPGHGRTRLFHVGRLDTETEGLLLLTNDGELAHRLTHPSYEVPKTYLAEVAGRPRATWASGCARVSSWRTARSRLGQLVDAGRQPDDGRARSARGPQPHRAPHAGGGRASGLADWCAPSSARCRWAR